LEVGSGWKDLAPVIAAEDGDIVAISPAAFFACSPLDGSSDALSEEDAEFWRSMRDRRGKPRRQTAYVALGIVAGVPFILDGAKRRRAWIEGLSNPPTEIFATVHQLMSLDQARRVAEGYKSSQKIERSAAAIQAAYREHGLTIQSHRLTHGAIGNAIYLAFRGSVFEDSGHGTKAPINLVDAVGVLREEIAFLDELGCPSRVFFSGILAMSFIALAIDPKSADLVEKIALKRGNKKDGKMDPAEAVLHLALVTEVLEPGRGAAYQAELFARSLRGFDKWRSAKSRPSRAWTKGILTATDPAPFVNEFRTAKGIAGRIDL
jgi:hypothetical protein